MMQHAIFILEEEQCRLRALIRTIGRNMHEVMASIDFSKEQEELNHVETALKKLRESSELEEAAKANGCSVDELHVCGNCDGSGFVA
jgi:hypothetical protein